jgi:hypothetical protein
LTEDEMTKKSLEDSATEQFLMDRGSFDCFDFGMVKTCPIRDRRHKEAQKRVFKI